MLLRFSQELQGAVTAALGSLHKTGPSIANSPLVLPAVNVLTTITTLEDQEPQITALTNELAAARSTIAERDARIQELENRPAPMVTTTDAPAPNDELTAIQNQLNEANDTIAAFETSLATVRRERDEFRTLTHALFTRPQGNSGTSAQKIPDPEKFTGNRDKLCPFLAQLRLKASTFLADQERLRYAVSVLDKDALDQVMPHIGNDRVNLDNLAALITILENAFGNPNRVADAEHKLASLQKGTRDFSTNYAEFQRYASETSWNDSAKLGALRRGLSYRLKQNLIAIVDEPQ